MKYLARKAGAALPGIIGMVVSFFFRVAAMVVEFVFKHLYLALAGIFAFVVGYIVKRKISYTLCFP